jgi:pyruvate/2-oxoacid:ferredoxin oxidoreductase beta subunit
MYIGNATGCSSIWANSSPSTAYTVNRAGCGPAWSNSLFEDGAEFGYGMLLAQKALRGRLKELVEQLMQGLTGQEDYKELTAACREWLDTFENGDLNTGAASRLINTIRELLQKGEKGNPKGSTPRHLETPGETKAQPDTIAPAQVIQPTLQNGSNHPTQNSLGTLQAFLPTLTELLTYKDYLAKKSHWIFGGDGFAYDIGF